MSDYKSPLKAAICEFKKRGITIKKGTENPFFKSRYADLVTVLDAIEEDAAECGLVIYSQLTAGDTTMLVTTLSHKDSDEALVSSFPVFGQKPQEIGSSISYARRYNIQSLLNLAAEDDDGNAASQPAKKESLASRNKRYEALMKELAESDDPSAVWKANINEINQFKADMGEEYYIQLVDVAGKRKEELKNG